MSTYFNYMTKKYFLHLPSASLRDKHAADVEKDIFRHKSHDLFYRFPPPENILVL